MHRRAQWLLEKAGALSHRDLLLWSLALAAAIEALTVLLRFGLHLESTRDTQWLGKLTFGLRIHHGYIGAAVVVAALALLRQGAWRNIALIVGAALFLSDMIHHFLVLWPITGSPEFHIRYSDYAKAATAPGWLRWCQRRDSNPHED